MFHGIPGVRVRGSDVRKVGFPKDVVDADAIAQLDADGLEPEIDVDLAPKQFAWPGTDSFGPEMAPFPLAIASFQNRTDPTQAGFGKDPVQPGKFFQHAGKNQEGNKLRGRAKVSQG